MYLITFKICVLKYANLILQNFFHLLDLAWKAALKKTIVKLDLLTDILMLLMVKKKVLEEEYATLFIYIQNLITNI